MTTQVTVRLFRERYDTDPLAEVEAPWPWVVPPPGCSYEIDRDDEVVRLWPRNAGGKASEPDRGRRRLPDRLVGTIPIVSWDPDRRRTVVTPIRVPPPEPFDDDALSRMWESILDHGAGIPTSVVLQGREAGTGRPVSVGSGLRSRLLGDLHDVGRSLLARWPVREAVETSWRPIEVVGGRENGRLTHQGLGRHTGAIEAGGRIVPQRTCRVLSTREEWKLSRVALISDAVHSALRTVVDEDVWDDLSTRRFLATFGTIARRARPTGRATDPPVSSWPTPFRRYLVLAVALLSELQAIATGRDDVPLSDFWRLYEEWSAIVVFHALREVLGDPSSSPGEGSVDSARWSAEWEFPGEGSIAVCSQPSFGSSPRALPGSDAQRFVSVTSKLIPDVALSVSDSKGTRLFLVDAKHRSSETGALSAGDVGSEAAKYLWGIRPAEDPERTDAVEAVLLVSPFPGAALHDRHRARATSTALLPEDGGGERPETVVARWLYDALRGGDLAGSSA